MEPSSTTNISVEVLADDIFKWILQFRNIKLLHHKMHDMIYVQYANGIQIPYLHIINEKNVNSYIESYIYYCITTCKKLNKYACTCGCCLAYLKNSKKNAVTAVKNIKDAFRHYGGIESCIISSDIRVNKNTSPRFPLQMTEIKCVAPENPVQQTYIAPENPVQQIYIAPEKPVQQNEVMTKSYKYKYKYTMNHLFTRLYKNNHYNIYKKISDMNIENIITQVRSNMSNYYITQNMGISDYKFQLVMIYLIHTTFSQCQSYELTAQHFNLDVLDVYNYINLLNCLHKLNKITF
jgi:hypothetical protein